jgi:flagellar hook-associated protein 1
MGLTLNAILNTGVSSLQAQQAALAVTSNNIANTNTDGYTRERAYLVSQLPFSMPGMQIGTGVALAGVQRLRPVLLDATYRMELGQQSRYEVLSGTAHALESVPGNINGTNLNTALTDFFNAFQDLSAHPADLAVRQAVVDKGAGLTDFFGEMSSQLGSLTAQQDAAVNSASDDINSMLQRLSVFNVEISRAELGGGTAAGLRDQRDLLLDQLSAYTDLSVSETSTGMVDVSANGQALVSGANVFAVQAVSNGGQLEVHSSNGVDIAGTGGKLRGYQESYQAVAQARTQLDGIANALITAVNALHAAPGAAFDLNGAQGLAFFSGTDAASIAVNAAVAADPAKVVAANTASPGNNGVALALAQVQDVALLPSGATLNDAATNLISGLGAAAQRADQLGSTYQSALDSVNTQRQAVGGVNMDEELSNIMAYQHAYGAAARVVTAVDEAMDTIINHTGHVGL